MTLVVISVWNGLVALGVAWIGVHQHQVKRELERTNGDVQAVLADVRSLLTPPRAP